VGGSPVVLAVSPLIVYGGLLLIPVVISIALRFLIVVPTRPCIQCGRIVAVTAFSCRHCGHRYTAEDREWMKLEAARRKDDYEAHQN
jgi:hypothetical protein